MCGYCHHEGYLAYHSRPNGIQPEVADEKVHVIQ